ncbi:putative follistatin-related protein 5-like [Triplophysa rosa]|uniref:Follistatin-related protein 5-like n=1 Tax=Triplophysa rosa TaxID=992332 RepID=A0A9W7X532_TRIRA|nr:putative follistatin-related protein 5-like [Triplophysa rosa]
MTTRQSKSSGKQVQRNQQQETSKMEESLAAMIASAMEKQQRFIDAHFKTLQDRLDNIQSELSSCSNGVRELRDRYSSLNSRVGKAEKNYDKCAARLTTFEEKMADLEDQSRRDNIRIINLPKGVEGKMNLTAYILGSLPVRLPAAKPEIMRAHRIGPPNNTGRPRTVIAKMQRYTDHDSLLRTSRKSSIKVDGKDIRFAADYSAFTTNRRRSFVEVIKKAQKIGFQTFLMYPAQLKLTRGSTQRIFKSHLEVEDFLGGLATQENVEGCSNGVRELRDRYSSLNSRVGKAEKNYDKSAARLTTFEEKMADLEDRSRRDNIRIINLPEGVEGKTNLMAYILGSLPVWLPALAEAKPEIMRAHRIGPPNNTGRPCTVIAKMLRYTDRDLLLRTSRKSSIKVDGKDIRFAADYSAFTTNRRCSFVEVIKKAQKIGFQTFLMYPAQLKLTRGLTQRIFKSHLEVEDFLGGLATQENVEG